MVLLGYTVTLCLCLSFSFAMLSGGYLCQKLNLGTADTNIPPLFPSATATPDENSPLRNLGRISVLPMTYSDSKGEGVAINITYFNTLDEVINFEETPIQVDIKLYAFRSILDSSDISNGTVVYQNIISLDHSPTLSEMFDNYIRIPYDEIKATPEAFTRFGTIKVVVKTPRGEFPARNTLVGLYPKQEEE